MHSFCIQVCDLYNLINLTSRARTFHHGGPRDGGHCVPTREQKNIFFATDIYIYHIIPTQNQTMWNRHVHMSKQTLPTQQLAPFALPGLLSRKQARRKHHAEMSLFCFHFFTQKVVLEMAKHACLVLWMLVDTRWATVSSQTWKFFLPRAVQTIRYNMENTDALKMKTCDKGLFEKYGGTLFTDVIEFNFSPHKPRLAWKRCFFAVLTALSPFVSVFATWRIRSHARQSRGSLCVSSL